jgi:hypothetical protein
VVGIDGECGAQEDRQRTRTQQLLGSYRPLRGEEGCSTLGRQEFQISSRSIEGSALRHVVEWSATSNPGLGELDADPVVVGFRLVPRRWVPRLAVRSGYRSRREPRPDRSPRSQRSLPPSATYGNSASSRARLTARAAWL